MKLLYREEYNGTREVTPGTVVCTDEGDVVKIISVSVDKILVKSEDGGAPYTVEASEIDAAWEI